MEKYKDRDERQKVTETMNLLLSPILPNLNSDTAISVKRALYLLGEIEIESRESEDKETCDQCKYFKILYEPLRTVGELWDMGRAKCDKHDLITDFANHEKFKGLDTCEDYEPRENEDKK